MLIRFAKPEARASRVLYSFSSVKTQMVAIRPEFNRRGCSGRSGRGRLLVLGVSVVFFNVDEERLGATGHSITVDDNFVDAFQAW